MTSINQIATIDAATSLETTITIGEGVLYVRHDTLDSRLDKLQADRAGVWVEEPTLARPWTVVLRMPGYQLDSYEHGDTLAEALAAILARYGRCKAQQYLDDDQYMDACISVIDGPTGRRF